MIFPSKTTICSIWITCKLLHKSADMEESYILDNIFAFRLIIAI